MIAFTADTHLWTHVWRSVRSLEGDSFRVFTEMVDVILAQPDEEKALVMAGDIFDESKVDGNPLRVFADNMTRLLNAGVKVYHVDGNHDKQVRESIPAIHGSISLHRSPVVIDGRTVVGLNWLPKTQLLEELSTLPAADILVLHCRLAHLAGYAQAADLAVEEIPDHFPSQVVGDIHVADMEELVDGFCLSPGSPHPCSLSETGDHGFWILREDKPVFHRLKNRKILRIGVSSDEELDRFRELALTPSADPGFEPLVEVTYAPEYLGRISDIEVLAKENIRHLFKRRQISNLLAGSQEAAEQLSGEWRLGLGESLPFAVDENEKPELFRFLAGLLAIPQQGNDDNVKEYIEAYAAM